MKNFLSKSTFLFFSGLILLVSCEKGEEKPDITANNLKGMFVVCEGTYGSAEGDITYHNSVTGTDIKSLYYSVNSVELGDVAQSFAIADTLGFIVVNNSQKVTVVNMKDFTPVKTIRGFSYPRSIVRADNNTMYLTNGNGYASNYIYSIDIATLEKRDSIAVSTGVESVIVVGTKAYVAVSGGWNNDGNTVLEINTETFTVVESYNVGSCPVDLVADKDNNIWVYCKGAPDYSNYPAVSYTDMGIYKVNASSGEVIEYAFSSMNASGINNIAVSPDGNTIFYLNDGLYEMSVTATSLPAIKLVDSSFYGVEVDPESGELICLDEINSKAIIYDTSGGQSSSFGTGKYPNSVVFSY